MKSATSVLLWALCIAGVAYLNVNDTPDNYSRRYLQVDTQGLTDSPFIQRVFISDDGICLNKRYHASIHDGRPGVKEDYVEWYTTHYKWDVYDARLPKVAKIQDPTLGIWNAYDHNSSTSLWNNDTHAAGPGWYAPPNPSIAANRTLVGTFAFYSTWFTGHYGHFKHDYLPSLAYIRQMATSSYGPDVRFILVNYNRNQELIKFMDPEFYNRVDWVKNGEVIKIEGEVMYLEPTSMPEMAGHAIMAYLREWIVEVHPFNQADFDANKHVVYYDRVGTTEVTNGRTLDADHQKKILDIIRAAMKRHGLGDQELVIFNGRNENNEPLSSDEQFQLFRRASTLIGPHGTGFSNMVWTNPNPKGCENRTKMLEFVVGADVEHVQARYAGHYRQFRGLPIDYHEIFYQIPSTNAKTFISLTDLDLALDAMWAVNQTINIVQSSSSGMWDA